MPIGPENSFNIGGADQGQPTHFLPRRNRFIFRVPVPAGFTDKDELIWTLTTQGKTEKAYASLRLDYQIDDVVRASETGALGAGSSSPEIRANKPPQIEVQGRKALTAKVGEAVALTAVVTDDGIPKRRGAGLVGRGRQQCRLAGTSRRRRASIAPCSRPRASRSARTSACTCRGSSIAARRAVTFSPEQIMSWEDTRAGANSPWAPVWVAPPLPADGKHTVWATFSEPGVYVLRSRADDGALTADGQVTITVTPLGFSLP